MTISEELSELSVTDAAFLDMIAMNKNKAWLRAAKLLDKEVLFKLETKAEVIVISEEVFLILSFEKLERPFKSSTWASRSNAPSVRLFQREALKWISRGQMHSFKFIGLTCCHRTDSTRLKRSFTEQLPNSFLRTRTMVEEHTIKLQEIARPLSLFISRQGTISPT